MTLSDPFIMGICDKCDEASDGIHLTPLAGGCWDARNVAKQLKRWGWKVEGETTLCPECQDESKTP